MKEKNEFAPTRNRANKDHVPHGLLFISKLKGGLIPEDDNI